MPPRSRLSLYAGQPLARGLRATFPRSDTLDIDGIRVSLVDFSDPFEPRPRRQWSAYVYSDAPVNVQPFTSRRLLFWWLKSDDGRQAVRQAWQAGQAPLA